MDGASPAAPEPIPPPPGPSAAPIGGATVESLIEDVSIDGMCGVY